MSTPTNHAVDFLAALPASILAPAGVGKTHLLTQVIASVTAEEGYIRSGQRVLVLTHTNAGVDVIRRRLQELGLQQSAQAATITSFAFELARAYPGIGQVVIPALPDWNNSQSYIEAAVRVAQSPHLQRMLQATFSHVLVDEYQDCTRTHHELILALQAAVNACGVLGDPMQAIFGFADPLVQWHEVQEAFPPFARPSQPWRWRGHNEDLGAWLLDLRSRLIPGTILDLANESLPRGVVLVPDVQRWTLKNTALRTGKADESVVVLTGVATAMVRAAAARLGGHFSAMEEIQGSFMREALSDLAARDPAQFAHWLAVTAKTCFEGYGDLNAGVLTALSAGRTVSHLRRKSITRTLQVLDKVQRERSLPSLAQAMHALANLSDARLHSHEAWYDLRSALLESDAPDARTIPSDSSVEDALQDALSRVREVRRHVGRRQRRRMVSRTVLVKGLEYDHVIITDIRQLNDVCNLYVALTRARKSLTILGPSALTLKATALGPSTSSRRRRTSSPRAPGPTPMPVGLKKSTTDQRSG